ncbi:MAG: hypothetical protein M0R33_15190 [Methylomonas sp.]|jgi:uncharacterized protein|uniref:hypothetical protein n=1 Tax=Methylomonas sp. TaxID=418 RepID=UPI0025ED13E4|nr:hypothetical protein [Methylomonas sp.]MCK9607786.1 hypothetical protein [Methylomonas sp.]
MEEPLLNDARGYVKGICSAHGIDESHAIKHAIAVENHIRRCFEADTIFNLDNQTKTDLLLAGLLHDVDDHKYFEENSRNAAEFLETRISCERASRVSRWISYVSASKNGNMIPPEAMKHPWVLWVRYCDRIEAVGVIGIQRTLEYNRRHGAPDFQETTPKATTREEVIKFATKERFEEYQLTGKSLSAIDHIFDKLLHLCDVSTSSPEGVAASPSSPYIDTQLLLGKQALIDVCINYGKFGRLILS